jgi:hypothetical protein
VCRKFHQDPLAPQRFSRKSAGSDARLKQPQVEVENSTYAGFYWISATIGRRESNAASPTRALVHSTREPAQLCVMVDQPVPICLDRHNFATDRSAFSAVARAGRTANAIQKVRQPAGNHRYPLPKS